MLPVEEIRKRFYGRPFTVGEAEKIGVSRFVLARLLRDERVEQIARGIYRAANPDLSEVDWFQAATAQVGKPSAICLRSALLYYDLSDLILNKTWIMVPVEKRTQYPQIQVIRKRKPYWNVGIEDHEGYSITSLERTIIDCLVHPKHVSLPEGLDALKQALSQNRTTPTALHHMAERLNVLHRARPYLEVLS